MKLYGSLTSPYTRKLRLLVAEKALPCQFVVADPGDADGPVARLNPLGKVPVLERDEGAPLFDSPVIAAYLDGLRAPALIPQAGEPRWTVLRWEALADGLMDAVVARLLECRRPAALQSASHLRRQEGKVAAALAFAEARLEGPYLCGTTLTYADLALGAAIEYTDLRYPHGWRGSCPRLAQWLAALAERPSFRDTRPSA